MSGLDAPWPLTLLQTLLVGGGLGLVCGVTMISSVHRVFFGHWRFWDHTIRRRR